MADDTPPLTAVAREAIRLTVWANIRRYILLSGLAFVTLVLAITVAVVLLFSHATQQTDLHHAQATACQHTATLAKIEIATVRQQAVNTTALEKSGVTFGIPKKQFEQLVKKSAKQRATYLAALNSVAQADCASLGS